MQWLFPSVVATLSSTLIFSFVYLYLYKTEHEASFGIWTISWLVYALRFACLLIVLQTGQTALLLAGNQLFSLLSALLLIWGTYVWLNKPIPKYWLFLGVLIAVWIVVAVSLNFSFMLLTLPTFIFLGLIYIWTGAVFILNIKHNTIGKYITGWAFILWGLHKIDYPFLRQVIWFAPWGYLLGSLFTVISAFGLVLVFFEKTKFELAESEAEYRGFVEGTDNLITKVDQTGSFTYMNHVGEILFGVITDKLLGMSSFEFVHPDDRERTQNWFYENVSKGRHQATIENRQINRQTGEVCHMLWTTHFIYDGNNELKEAKGIAHNVTNRIQAEEKIKASLKEKETLLQEIQKNEDRLKNIIENMPVMLNAFDENSRIIIWNSECERITGRSKEEMITHPNPMELLYPDRLYRQQILDAMIKGENNLQNREWRLVAKDGTERHVTWRNNSKNFPIEGWAVWATGMDTTERNLAEEHIKSSLKEKEILLYEIHHRVKNNMAVISSLLKLQSNNTADHNIKEILQVSRNRIYAMSAVHETLHGSEYLSEIDLETYISKVTSSIFQTYSVAPDKIKLNTDIEEIPISINQASPLGLVINELISNSLKHAFPDERKGTITLNLNKLDTELELIVMDDGVGIPDGFDWKISGSLGLKLVRTLVENQLDGSVDMESNNGTKFTIKFVIGT